MQFHLNGFRTGDPHVAEASPEAARTSSQYDKVDVLIVGCGPAGLTLAAQLSAFPDIKTKIVEQKSGPLRLGQADGIACRTMEMFEAFGFSERVEKEGYWVNETTFWRPDSAERSKIVRYDRIQDVEDGLSEFPHMILNQARVHDFYLDVMRNSASRLEPSYSRSFAGLEVSSEGNAAHPVKVSLKRLDADNKETIETVEARYVVGCDGARSAVRQSLGRSLHGDAANQAWGVMDVLAVTDFPDIRYKALIQSASEGSIVLIPREGGYLVRIYVEMDKLSENERVAGRNITVDHLIAATQRILRPYSFEVKEVAWWSVYEIGQRLTDKFDDVPEEMKGKRVPRVFIAGDACHTHSPKAGQGMNVSMQDAFNLGWKLAAVLRGQCAPEFLHTYSAERHAVAKELIDFDREWVKMISAPLKSASNPNGVDPEEVRSYFVRHGRYTAGTATKYEHSLLTAEPSHQNLAKGFIIGTRFHSAPVIRLGDAKKISLGHTVKADGRWRVFIFSDRGNAPRPSKTVKELCGFLENAAGSPLRKFTSSNADTDAVIDVRAIFQQSHRELDLNAMPEILWPRKGRYGLRDYEKIFCPDFKDKNDIFDMRGIDRDKGCIVIVRPDQYVANILPLNAHAELGTFFSAFMLPVSN
jgi:2-polyprenyl-6-methoxyphenol hydroxylase-like FAD-dependent oxidoreductase